MIKISDVIHQIILENPALNFGFHHRLLNLSQVARFIKPIVETRTHKEVTESAVLMNLSRLQAKMTNYDPSQLAEVVLDKVTVHSGLCTMTVTKSARIHRRVNDLFARVRDDDGFITITEGLSEITIILDNEHFELARKTLGEEPRFCNRNLASVGVKFSEKMMERPGLIYQLMQQVVLLNINVIEVVSTATEFNIYMHENDVERAFEGIYRRFSVRSRRI